MTGTYHVFRLGRDERDITLLGPFFYESGVRGGTYWQQTRNGITYTYAGVHENRDARSDTAWLTSTDPHDVRLIANRYRSTPTSSNSTPPAAVTSGVSWTSGRAISCAANTSSAAAASR